jgi:hypothetical protein
VFGSFGPCELTPPSSLPSSFLFLIL